MTQLILALLGRIDEAGIVPHSEIVKITSYRDAVRACWMLRRSQRMTQETLAERVAGMYSQHLSDYICVSDVDKHGSPRRSLPAAMIPSFEAVCGNKFITQWIVYQSGLNLLESVTAERKAA